MRSPSMQKGRPMTALPAFPLLVPGPSYVPIPASARSACLPESFPAEPRRAGGVPMTWLFPFSARRPRGPRPRADDAQMAALQMAIARIEAGVEQLGRIEAAVRALTQELARQGRGR